VAGAGIDLVGCQSGIDVFVDPAVFTHARLAQPTLATIPSMVQGVDDLIVIDGHPCLETTHVVPDDGVVGRQRDSACQTLRIWRIIKE